MSDLQVSSPTGPPSRLGGRSSIRNGAELVHLAEQLYVHFLQLVLVLLLLGCGLSVSLGGPNSTGSPRPLTLTLAVLAAAFAVVGLARSQQMYRWLRCSEVRQVAPAVVAAVAVAINGPDSASWWVALPLLWVVAVVGSTSMLVVGALATGGAYLAGTLFGGEPLIHDGDNGIVAAAIGLPVNAIAGRFASEAFARFVLRLHQLERRIADRPRPPITVPNLAAKPPVQCETRETAGARFSPPASAERRERARAALNLTARQLEAALLACDGLRQGEIAGCLSISPRQVERLIHDGRARAGAQTTSQLAAMLVAAQIAPDSPE